MKNSNTDRLVKAVLDASGLESEFVKLCRVNVRPCFACKQCVPDNTCKVQDDFQALAEKIKKAKALVIGAYIPYGQIDAFTKALLERFWSLRHVNNLLRGKLAATVLIGLAPDVLDNVNHALAGELRDYERMELVGQLTAISVLVFNMKTREQKQLNYHKKRLVTPPENPAVKNLLDFCMEIKKFL